MHGYPSSPAPEGKWRVDKHRRISGFRWLLVPKEVRPDLGLLSGGNDAFDIIVTLLILVPFLVDLVILAPTLGLVRLVRSHRRAPGWYVRVRYTVPATDGRYDFTVNYRTVTRRPAKRLRKAIRRELRRDADLNSPAVQTAVVANQATAEFCQPPVSSTRA